LQALASAHTFVLSATLRQPKTWSQLSSVQGLLSLQLGGGPLTHTPLEQKSSDVQMFPSLQALVLSLT
jgi:hypothetical protein